MQNICMAILYLQNLCHVKFCYIENVRVSLNPECERRVIYIPNCLEKTWNLCSTMFMFCWLTSWLIAFYSLDNFEYIPLGKEWFISIKENF